MPPESSARAIKAPSELSVKLVLLLTPPTAQNQHAARQWRQRSRPRRRVNLRCHDKASERRSPSAQQHHGQSNNFLRFSSKRVPGNSVHKLTPAGYFLFRRLRITIKPPESSANAEAPVDASISGTGNGVANAETLMPINTIAKPIIFFMQGK